MATKLQLIRELSEKTADDLALIHGNWQRFLKTSARLYKYSFPDQLLIYAQKPDAVAVAEIELWNDNFNRWVRRGTKGIALIDDSGSYTRLRHVFDVNDTEPSRLNARPVQLWEMRQEHKDSVLAALADSYDDIDEGDSLADTFRNIADILAKEYYSDNTEDIQQFAEESVLEPQAVYDLDGAPYDERDSSYLESVFTKMLSNSIAYTLMSRCGLDADGEYEDEDFQNIADFNTIDIICKLGTATSELSEQVLRDIEIVIKKYERAKDAQLVEPGRYRRLEEPSPRSGEHEQNAERSEENYDRNPYLQPRGRLSSPGFNHGNAGGPDAAGTLRTDAESVSERASDGQLQPPAADGEAVSAFEGDRPSGDGEIGAVDDRTDGADESARQGDRPNGVDGGDELAESPSGGNGYARTDLRVNEILSDSAVSIGEFDTILRDGGNSGNSMFRIAAFFAKGKSAEDNTAFLKNEFLTQYRHTTPSGKGFAFTGENGAPLHSVCAWYDERGINLAVGTTALNNIHKVTIPWDVAAGRIEELFNAGLYVTPETLADALDNEHRELAGRLWNFYRDDMDFLPEEWKAERGGNPDDEALIKSLLDDPDEWQAILDRLEADVNQFNYDGDKRSWHDPDRLLADMRDAMIAPKTVPDDGIIPHPFKYFITQDEIDADLAHGSSVSEGKYRTLSFFLNNTDETERVRFLKDEYGTGSRSWSEGNGHQDHSPGKGITLTRGGYGASAVEAEVNLKWPAVARRIDTLIKDGRYMSRAELDVIPSYEKVMLARSINTFYYDVPNDTRLSALEKQCGELELDESLRFSFGGKVCAIVKDGELNEMFDVTVWDDDEPEDYLGIHISELAALVDNEVLGEEYVKPFLQNMDFYYPREAEFAEIDELLRDNERVDTMLGEMRYIFENTSTEDRYYDSREAALEKLTAFSGGTYTLFPGINNLISPEAAKERQIEPPRRDNGVVISLDDGRPSSALNEPQPPAVQLSLFDTPTILPSVDEQRERIDRTLREEAAEVMAASSVLENDTDAVLLNISAENKARLYEQFADSPRSREAVNLVREIYGTALPFPLPQAIKRITELVELGRLDGIGDPYNLFDNVRDLLSERGYAVSGELVEDGINEFRSRVGFGDFTAVADFIQSEYLTEEPELGEEIDEPKPELHLRAVGDFYELTGAEARIAADVLGFTVALHDDDALIGFPNHALEDYVGRLAEAGYAVIMPEPVEAAKEVPPYNVGDRLIYNGKLHEITKIDAYVQVENRELDNPSRFQIFDRVSLLRGQFELALTNGELTIEPPREVQPEPTAEPAQLTQDVPAPDFEEVRQTVFDRVMADDNFAYHLQFAQSRGALRSPLNTALDRVIGELQAEEPAIYANYFNDDNTDELFDHVYRTAWENRPQPEQEQQSVTTPAMVIDQAARQNYNLFALTFPQIFDGTYQSVWYKDENDRELAVWHDAYNVGLIRADISRYPTDGQPISELTLLAAADFDRSMLTAENIDYNRAGTSVYSGLLEPASGTDEEKAQLGLELTEFISNIRSQKWTFEEAEAFRDADGNELPAEPKANLTEFFAERAERYLEDLAQLMQDMFAPNAETPEAEKPAPPPRDYIEGSRIVLDLREMYENAAAENELANFVGEFNIDSVSAEFVSVRKNELEIFLSKEKAAQYTVEPIAERVCREPGADYYLFRYPDGVDAGATVSRDDLALIPEYAKSYVICAEDCDLSDADMERLNITFRKMPRDFGLLPSEAQMRITELAPRYREQWQADQETRETPAVQQPRGTNFRITDDHLGEGGAKTKFRGNIEAIKTLREIETENRNAMPEEQEILSRYVGWGGLQQAFKPDDDNWASEYEELKNLLTPEEYEFVSASTLNAHYTSPTVIKAMWETVERLGFKRGNILEPSMGIGNFYGLIPQDLWQSKLYGVELDEITARIAKQLYPNANIQQMGFEKTEFSDAFFDLAIGNVPFGSYNVFDGRYKQGFPIHDYFFQKSLDKVRSGGVIALITSKYTLDKQNPEARKYIAQRAELLGAVRLPNNAFLKNAGTETTMDILFLQKRDRPLDIEPDWVHLGFTEDGIPINQYFLDNPEMVLGTMGLDEKLNGKYGRNNITACLPIEGADLGEQLNDALSLIQGRYTVEELDDLDGVDNHAIEADFNVKNFSYAVVDERVYFRENSKMYPVDLPATTLARIKGMIELRDCVNELISLQLDDYGEDVIKAKQRELSDLYDGFAAEYGLINGVTNNRAFSADSSYYLLCSLEILNDDKEFVYGEPRTLA